MKIIIKLTGQLYQEILRDMQRPHPFAAERIGFVAARIGALGEGKQLVLLTRYHPIADTDYVEDAGVGARIGSEAITRAMHAVYHGRQNGEGVFHVHLHGHTGRTGMSGTDRREIPPMVSSFQSVGQNAPHGIIILSLNHGSAWVWMPTRDQPLEAATMNIIGNPIHVFDREAA